MFVCQQNVLIIQRVERGFDKALLFLLQASTHNNMDTIP